MNHLQLKKSLTVWQARKMRFYKNWMGYKRVNSKNPRRAYWYSQYKAATKMVARRLKQLAPQEATSVSDAGARFIGDFEGYRGYPYQDVVGVWTIGYGHTEGVNRNSKHITQAEATALLRSDLNHEYAPPVVALPMKFTQNQLDALVSFVYNLGPGVLNDTTLRNALRAQDRNAIGNALLLYDHAGGRALEGLTRRRQAERKLFLS